MYNDLLDDFFTYSYSYYVWGFSLTIDEDFDRICHILYEHWDEITNPDKDRVDRDMMKTQSAFNLKGYPRRCITKARKLADKKGFNWNIQSAASGKYRDKHCPKHNQHYGKHLDVCPICRGDSALDINGKLKWDRYCGK